MSRCRWRPDCAAATTRRAPRRGRWCTRRPWRRRTRVGVVVSASSARAVRCRAHAHRRVLASRRRRTGRASRRAEQLRRHVTRRRWCPNSASPAMVLRNRTTRPCCCGEPPDHEQTHVPRGVRVDLAAGLQARVGHAQIRFGHPETDVADLDDQPAVAGVHRRHPHLRYRRRVAQRVVEQLGEQVHQIACDRSDDLAVGHRRGDDPGVVLDLGGGGVDDRRHRHRLGLLARHLRAREHQQVGAVAAHPGGQVIEPEQALQPLGILLVALQPVDERQLLVDQRSGCAATASRTCR